MKIGNYFNKFAPVFLMLLAASFSFAQTIKTATPRQEKLLNDLKILLWQDAGSDQATVKLRIHSGAAFDTLGKEGTMALLADALFPNEIVKEFFREDLNGSLAVESNYDYIQINVTGNADQILTILETVANAVTKLTLDKETTAKVKAARIERIKELEKSPAYVRRSRRRQTIIRRLSIRQKRRRHDRIISQNRLRRSAFSQTKILNR